MLRNTRFHRLFRAMAMLAVSLLIVMPMLSGMMRGHTGASQDAWIDICTSGGLKRVLLSDFEAHRQSPLKIAEVPREAPQNSHEALCGYCILLQEMLPILLVLWLLAAMPAVRFIAVRIVLHRFARPSLRRPPPTGPPLLA